MYFTSVCKPLTTTVSDIIESGSEKPKPYIRIELLLKTESTHFSHKDSNTFQTHVSHKRYLLYACIVMKQECKLFVTMTTSGVLPFRCKMAFLVGLDKHCHSFYHHNYNCFCKSKKNNNRSMKRGLTAEGECTTSPLLVLVAKHESLSDWWKCLLVTHTRLPPQRRAPRLT